MENSAVDDYMDCGVYVIKNELTGATYVGSSSHFTARRANHFWSLKMGVHYNARLQEDFDQHGITAFSTRLVELVEKEHLAEREDFWIGELKAERTGKPPTRNVASSRSYNINPSKGSAKGRTFSDGTRSRMTGAAVARYQTEEGQAHRERLAAGRRGRVVSPETKAKMVASQLARWAAKRLTT